MRSTFGNYLHQTCKGCTHSSSQKGFVKRQWASVSDWIKLYSKNNFTDWPQRASSVSDPTCHLNQLCKYTQFRLISVPQIQFSAIKLGGVLSICVRKHIHIRLHSFSERVDSLITDVGNQEPTPLLWSGNGSFNRLHHPFSTFESSWNWFQKYVV